MKKIVVIFIGLFILGILIPKFFIVRTFSDIYGEEQFKCIDRDLAKRNKLIVMTSSYGYSNKDNYFKVRDYTFFGIRIEEREILC